MNSSEISGWVEAIGTVGSALVAVTIAVVAWMAELRRRGESVRNALFLAEQATMQFTKYLQHLEEYLNSSGQISTTKAQAFAVSGVLAELNVLFGEIRPIDMPNFQAANAYMGLRISVRDLQATLEFVASRPGGTAKIPVAKLNAQVGDAFAAFNKARARYNHPLQPEWLVRANAARLERARDKAREREARKAH